MDISRLGGHVGNGHMGKPIGEVSRHLGFPCYLAHEQLVDTQHRGGGRLRLGQLRGGSGTIDRGEFGDGGLVHAVDH